MTARGTCKGRNGHRAHQACPDPECYRFEPHRFADRLVDARDWKGWSQATLAHEASRFLDRLLTPQEISDYERGRKEPKLTNARALAMALGMPLDDLL